MLKAWVQSSLAPVPMSLIYTFLATASGKYDETTFICYGSDLMVPTGSMASPMRIYGALSRFAQLTLSYTADRKIWHTKLRADLFTACTLPRTPDPLQSRCPIKRSREAPNKPPPNAFNGPDGFAFDIGITAPPFSQTLNTGYSPAH
jgi:hypothetical protein